MSKQKYIYGTKLGFHKDIQEIFDRLDKKHHCISVFEDDDTIVCRLEEGDVRYKVRCFKLEQIPMEIFDD